MFLRKSIYKSTADSCDEQLTKLKKEIETADAIVIGAGAGLSASAGMSYSGARFEKYFSDFHRKYGITDMYSGGFYPFDTLEEYWAWWSRHIWVNRYGAGVGKPYADLLELVKDKDYFVLTTNVDHQFQLAGFDKKRLFYTQGDYGLLQCSRPCHHKTYDNYDAVREMVESQGYIITEDGEMELPNNESREASFHCDKQQDDSSIGIRCEKGESPKMIIPSELVPHCPICGEPMNVNLRCDDTFVEDEGWHQAAEWYHDFIRRHENLHILFLELGVGANTPVIIKYPFWQMTAENPKAVYACVNYGETYCPREISGRAICIDDDIGRVLAQLV